MKMEQHISIPVKDLEESRKFYEEFFGYEVTSDWENQDLGLKALWLEADGNLKIELIWHEDNKGQISEWILPHIGFEVKNIEQLLNRFKGKGVEIIMPLSKGQTVKEKAFIKDPNGLAIEVYEK